MVASSIIIKIMVTMMMRRRMTRMKRMIFIGC